MSTTLEILTHESLAQVKHGFFTRKGGASSGIFHGLNCGQGSSDQSEAVSVNRERVASAMDISATNLISVHQVHSPDVVIVKGQHVPPPKADAMVTTSPGLGLAILTADCMPVLFHDPYANVIGAAHAGWRGALSGVLEATVAAMLASGAKREQISAVIGPAISQRAYEVGPEFINQFLQEDTSYDRFFAQGTGDKLQFDLPGFGLHRLRSCGIEKAFWTGHCTYSDPERFFSYRRSVHDHEADYGRLISVIRL